MYKFYSIIFLLFTSVSYSQDVFDIIAKETCECINAKKIDYKNIEEKKLQVELGVCMIKSFSTHREKLNKEDQIAYSDKEGMRKLGQEIGIKMMNHCPDFMIELGLNVYDKQEKKENVVEEAIEYKFVEGEIMEIKSDQFITIKVKDKNSRTHQLLLLDFFETANLVTNNKIRKGDRIIANYNDIELYDAKEKEYRLFKVITNLVKNN